MRFAKPASTRRLFGWSSTRRLRGLSATLFRRGWFPP